MASSTSMNQASPGAVNPYAPPTAEGQPLSSAAMDFYREGNDLVVRKESSLPDICLRTGEPTGGRLRTKKLSWIPPWTIVVFIVIRLIGLICMLVARKTAHLTFALSEQAEAKRKQAVMLGLGVAGLGIVLVAAGVALESDAGVGAALLGGIAMFVGIILAAVLNRPYQLRKMAGDYMYLRIKPVALEAFEAYRAQAQVVAAPVPSQSPFG